jgi:hypothetical protein
MWSSAGKATPPDEDMNWKESRQMHDSVSAEAIPEPHITTSKLSLAFLFSGKFAVLTTSSPTLR